MQPRLKDRKVTAEQEYDRPPMEVLHLIRKLRWMGMQEQATQVQKKLCDTTSTGGVITATHETD